MMIPRLILGISLLLTFWQGSVLNDRLLEAARVGDVKLIESLLDQGADMNATTRYGVTPLHYAADKGHTRAVRFLLGRGAVVNVSDRFYGATPLTWSLSNGHLEIARLLVEAGATDVSPALMAAVRAGNERLLQSTLGNPHLSEEAMSEALGLARRGNARDMVKMLLAAGAREEVAKPVVDLTEDELQRFPGKYRDDDSGLVFGVTRSGKQLFAAWPGKAPLQVQSLGNGETTLEGQPVQLVFSGRGGIVERVVVTEGSSTLLYTPVSDGELAELKLLEERARNRATAAVDENTGATESRPWGSFRGDRGSGHSDRQNLPTHWNVETGENVRWKTAIPGIATSSPVAWSNQVFLTTAESENADTTFVTGLYGDVKPVDDLSETRWKLYSLDLLTGRIQWGKVVHQGVPGVKRHTKSSQANSSPATDGKNVVVLFGSVGILANYDLEGNLRWKKDLGILNSGWFYDADYQWGHASSPVIYRDSVIVQADIQSNSFLAAYRLSDGAQIWRSPREEIPTWGTPTVYEGPTGAEVVTNGPTIRSYDPANGKLLWQLAPNSEVTVGSPVIHENLIIVTAGYPPVRPIYAVRAGSRGDLSLPEGQDSSPSVAWSRSRGGTYIPTPIVYRGYFYTNANNGRLTSYDAATGEQIYRARIGGTGGSFAASPVASDGNLFFSSEDGIIYVVKAGPVYQDLAQNEMGEIIMATPAIANQTLVVRTLGHVYGIGRPPVP